MHPCNLNVPVLLTCEEVERILCTKEVVIINDFHSSHPLMIAVPRDLTKEDIIH